MDVLSYVMNKNYTDELKYKVVKHLVSTQEPQKPIGHTRQVSGYGVASIPSNAKGQISVVLKGNTYRNVVYNGNFSQGATGWANQFSPISVSNNTLVSTATGIIAQPKVFGTGVNQNLLVGRKYFIRAKVRVTNSNATSIELQAGDGVTSLQAIVNVSSPIANQWYVLYSVVTIPNTTKNIVVIHTYPDAATAAGKVMEIQEVFAIDITGTELESLTANQINARIPHWFDSVKSTVSAFRIQTKDDAGNIISQAYAVAKDDMGNIIELRSLPNGTKDEFNVVEGKYTKNVSDPVSVSGTMFASLDTTTYVNVDVVKTTAFSDAKAGTTAKDGMTRLYDKNGVELTEIAQTDIDNTASVGKYYWHTDKTLWLIVAKGAYADISAARTALGTMTLNYQLATPIISKVDVVGDLVAYPNGHIFTEPCMWGFMTEPKKVVTTPDLPIQEVRKVIRYDISENGKLIETDVTADVTVGDNNTSLTIANFERCKVYFYDCSFAQELTTQAEIVADVEVDNGVVTHDYGASAADWVLDSNESKATMLVCTNAGGAAKIIAPATEGKMYIVKNNSGQTITIKTASSTGVMVANGKTATVVYYDTDFIKLSEV